MTTKIINWIIKKKKTKNKMEEMLARILLSLTVKFRIKEISQADCFRLWKYRLKIDSD